MSSLELPLFPLHAVLFPGGLLPLRIFEQRYVAMIKARLDGDKPFGVCLIRQGHEVLDAGKGAAAAPLFADIGTTATVSAWDMPQLGILHIRAQGGTRFHVRSHKVQADGLVLGSVTPIADEPAVALSEEHQPLAALLEALAAQIGAEHFPAKRAFGDSSWVGFRLAELLPLPLSIKQNMLEISDSTVRLDALLQFLRKQGVL